MRPDRPRSRPACRPGLVAEGGLEPRHLLTAPPFVAMPATESPPPSLPQRVDFDRVEFVASQADPTATIAVTRASALGPLEVRVRTDPSPAAGRNYQAIDARLTFADGETTRTVEVPLVAGAPNPGEIAVGLRLQPLTNGWTAPDGRPDPSLPPRIADRDPLPPATLRIVGRPEVTPPQVVATQLDRDGLTLTFSEPMDPARARDRRNYVVVESRTERDTWVGWVASPLGSHSTNRLDRVPIRSAVYDPATNSVTLVPARPLNAEAQYAVTSPRLAQPRNRLRTVPLRALTDAVGNPLGAPRPASGTGGDLPGSFRFLVPRGRTSPPRV